MSIVRTLAALAAAALLAACQTTSIQSAWFDTSYRGGPFKKVVVIASDGTTADSRVFEDIFVQKLTAAGITAVPGYTTVPPDARRAEAPFAAAVAATGADGVIIVRLIRVDTKTQVSTMMMPGPMMGPWGGFYGPGLLRRRLLCGARSDAIRRGLGRDQRLRRVHPHARVGGDHADRESRRRSRRRRRATRTSSSRSFAHATCCPPRSERGSYGVRSAASTMRV